MTRSFYYFAFTFRFSRVEGRQGGSACASVLTS
jgi:hypothetical protein